MSIVNAIYTALFPSKGALPSLSTDYLTQCILNITNSKLAISEIELMEQLLAILLKNENSTSAWRFPFFYSSTESMLRLSPPLSRA
jgi:hypothetical protein